MNLTAIASLGLVIALAAVTQIVINYVTRENDKYAEHKYAEPKYAYDMR
jgi:hypothetical protein